MTSLFELINSLHPLFQCSAFAPDPIPWNFRYLRYIKYANPRAVPKGNQGSNLVGQLTFFFFFDIFKYFSLDRTIVFTIRAGKRETWSTTYTPRTIYDGGLYGVHRIPHLLLRTYSTFSHFRVDDSLSGSFYSTPTNRKPIITDQRSVV